MPTYDYRCSANGAVVEVRHSMNDSVQTWGQVCELANLDPGEIALDAPVEKLITGGQVVNSHNLKEPAAPSCGLGGCASGMCGLS